MKVTLFTDGGVRTGGVRGPTRGYSGPASIGFVIRDAGGTVLRSASAAIGEATVNEAEYSALIAGLFNAYAIGATEVEARSDSQCVVNQMSGTWAVRTATLVPYLEAAKVEEAKFTRVVYKWIPRRKNKVADGLTRQVFD